MDMNDMQCGCDKMKIIISNSFLTDKTNKAVCINICKADSNQAKDVVKHTYR